MRTIAVIVDIDGTLSDSSHRLHHILKERPKNFKAFHEKCVHDPVIDRARQFILSAVKDEIEVILLSGRDDRFIAETKEWLNKHSIPYHKLILRQYGDRRPCVVFKKEAYEKFIKPYHLTVMAIDDMPDVLEMWESVGVEGVPAQKFQD